jgi:hypothetical protein
MKMFPVVALFIFWSSAAAQVVVTPNQPTDTEAIRAQIKADRAKARADEENGPKSRFWDRDAEGKRPWERTLPQE